MYYQNHRVIHKRSFSNISYGQMMANNIFCVISLKLGIIKFAQDTEIAANFDLC
jgi:hypothetical protein